MRWWKSTAQWLGTGILGFAGLFLAGCEGADGIAPVSGVVTLNGAPLPDALVRFQPQPTGSPSSAITDSSGRFTLKYTRDANGAQVGEHLVAISTYSPGDPDAEPPRPPVPEKVPPQYNRQSTLTATVKSGANQLDFKLDATSPVAQPKPGSDD